MLSFCYNSANACKITHFSLPVLLFIHKFALEDALIQSITTSKSQPQYVTQTKQDIPFMLHFDCSNLPFLPFRH
jgi:hypothetical protein